MAGLRSVSNSVIPTGGDHRKAMICVVEGPAVSPKPLVEGDLLFSLREDGSISSSEQKRERAARKRASGECVLRTIEAESDPEYTAMVEHFGATALAGAGLPTPGFILPLKVESQAHAA